MVAEVAAWKRPAVMASMSQQRFVSRVRCVPRLISVAALEPIRTRPPSTIFHDEVSVRRLVGRFDDPHGCSLITRRDRPATSCILC